MSDPEIVTVEPAETAVVRGVVAMSDISDFFDRSFRVLGQVLGEQGVQATGPAYARYFGQPTDTVSLEVGFPTDRAIEATAGAEPGALPGGRVARLVHEGSFDGLGDAWGQLYGWAVEQGHRPGEAMWEVYLTEPSPEMDPADLRTELNLSVSD